jgi:hypothetical protein
MGDKQKLAILESKRVLRSRMNNRLPIFRLPTEILAMVFKNLEEDQRFDESASSDVPAGVVSADCGVAYALERMCVQRAGHLWTCIILVMYKKPAPPRRCLNPVLSHPSTQDPYQTTSFKDKHLDFGVFSLRVFV